MAIEPIGGGQGFLPQTDKTKDTPVKNFCLLDSPVPFPNNGLLDFQNPGTPDSDSSLLDSPFPSPFPDNCLLDFQFPDTPDSDSCLLEGPFEPCLLVEEFSF